MGHGQGPGDACGVGPFSTTTDRMSRGSACLALALLPLAETRGEAAFDNAVLYGAGPIPETVVIGDLDGDRDQDLAIVNRSGHLQVLFNNGNGTFQNAVSYNDLWPSGPTGGYTLDARIADLDRRSEEHTSELQSLRH